MIAQNKESNHWTLDKRVPIGLIITLGIQTVAVGIWLGTVQARLNYVEGYIDNRQSDVSRLAVLETRINAVQQTLSEMRSDIKNIERSVSVGKNGNAQ